MAFGYFGDSTEDMAGRFGAFLEGCDEGRGIQHFYSPEPGEPLPSLMDLIGGWVLYGDATHVCGSYENFLLAVISITDHWLREGVAYWVDDEREVPIEQYRTATNDDEDYVLMHNALNRTLWNVISAKHSSKRDRDLLWKIEVSQRT